MKLLKLEIRKNSIWLFPILALIFVIFVSGCQDSGTRMLTGSTNLNAYTVLQGVVTGESLRHSVQRVSGESVHSSVQRVWKSAAAATSETATVSETATALETAAAVGDDSGMEVALVTEKGLLLQRKYFTTRDENGALRYYFEGDFGSEALRLRFYETQRLFEVAIGTPGENKVLELSPIDYQKAALATRYLEQSAMYSSLRKKEPAEFKTYIDAIVQEVVQSLGQDFDQHLENIERVGVNESGVLQVFPTNYLPEAYREPEQSTLWEEGLRRLLGHQGLTMPAGKPNSRDGELGQVTNNPIGIDGEEDGEEYGGNLSSDDREQALPLPTAKVFVNWLAAVYSSEYLIGDETLLYRSENNSQLTEYHFSNVRYLHFDFKRGCPAEYIHDFKQSGVLQFTPYYGSSVNNSDYAADCRQNISLSSLEILESSNRLSVLLDLWELLPKCRQSLFFSLDSRLTSVRPDEIPLVRANFIVKGV